VLSNLPGKRETRLARDLEYTVAKDSPLFPRLGLREGQMLAKSWLKTGTRQYTRGPQTLWDSIVRAPIMHDPGPVLRSLFTDA
jgi:hypothetical protein